MRLKVVMIWHLYQPSVGMELGWAQENAWDCYSQIPVIYKRHPSLKAGINLQGVLIRQLQEFNPEILSGFSERVNKGQFELLTSAYYHPLLPLWPEEDIKGQIELNTDTIKQGFGVEPRGLWLPELAWSPLLLKPLTEMGISWTVVDSVTWFEARRRLVGEVSESNPELGREPLNALNYGEVERPKGLYLPSSMKIGSYAMSFLHRDHQLSRYLGEPEGVLTGVSKPKKLLAQLKALSIQTGGKGVAVLAADGEKIGGRGEAENLKNFESLLEALETADFLQLVTPSEALDDCSTKTDLFLPASSQHGGFEHWLSLPEDLLFYNRIQSLREKFKMLYQTAHPKYHKELVKIRLKIWELESSTWNTWHFEPAVLRIKGYELLWEIERKLEQLKEKADA